MRIAFFSRNQNFAGPLLEDLVQHHTVRIWRHNTSELANQLSISQLLNWCDVAYLEWLQPPSLEISQAQGVDKPIVAFCHGIDVMNHFMMEWRNISGLIVQDALWPRLQLLRESWPHQNPQNPRLADLPKKLLIQSIGVDTSYFTPEIHKKPGYEVVIHASSVRATKRIYSALQQFYDLVQTDPGNPWHLTLVGEWYNDWEFNARREYLEACDELLPKLNLGDRLTITDKNFNREEWRNLLLKSDIYWCTSWRESFGSSLAEAAACGVYPLVNDYLGADTIYPAVNRCKSSGEFVAKTLLWAKQSEKDKDNLRGISRQIVAPKYDSRVAAGKIRRFLEDVKESYRK